jgi:hypothetical protein
MTIENTEKQSTKTGPNPADLSREVFKNPQEVLSVLKDNFKKLSANHADSPMLMKNDLIAYATTGADPKVRAAAGIAASHFDDLTKISNQGKRPIATANSRGRRSGSGWRDVLRHGG